MSTTPLVTVIFPLYNTEHTASPLVQSLLSQTHPSFKEQSQWLKAVFMDDCSRDGTFAAFEQALRAVGSPSHIQLIRNEKNQGLARTLNIGFQSSTTPYVLSCHCDCLFGSPDYISKLIDIADRSPQLAALTAQQSVDFKQALPFSERLNLVSNLMDLFPPPHALDRDWYPIAFAEGRCDLFRKSIMERVGYYDTDLRTSGEDQILAAKLRTHGFEVGQTFRAQYKLGVSTEQDSLWKLIKHRYLFGETLSASMIISLRRSSAESISWAGENRKKRALLRLNEVALLLISPFAFCSSAARLGFALILLARAWIYQQHLSAISFSRSEYILFWLIQPVFSWSYGVGFLRGLWIGFLAK